jgi:hypothetical protein
MLRNWLKALKNIISSRLLTKNRMAVYLLSVELSKYSVKILTIILKIQQKVTPSALIPG